MSFQTGIKKSLAVLAALTITACSAGSVPAEEETVSILVPAGAPAMGMLGAFEADHMEIEVTEGTDLLSAELAKKDSEYDVIVAPVNLGVKVYENTQTYKLEGILTWGNLYLVGEEENQWEQADVSIAAFGQTAVPGLVFNALLPEAAAKAEYYPSVAEASQALLAGQADVALLAQPVAAAAIAKGAEAGKDLRIIADLQKMWQETYNSANFGYPQAAIFVKEEDADKAQRVIEAVQAFLDDADDTKIEEAVDATGADVLGVPSAKLAAKTWKAQNIHYVPGLEAKEDLDTFLALFGIEVPADIYMN